MKKWIIAARPKTLPAAFSSVMLGASIAYNDGYFSSLNTAIALICAILFQIGSNYVNDLYDYFKGADLNRKSGPTRAVTSGIITVEEMKKAIIIVFALSFVLGLYLVYDKGWIAFVIGILSIISAIAYTAGPFPLAYNGLGELFVFIFFGIFGVNGAYYINTGQFSSESLILSIPLGLLIANILVVNNYRDYEEDKINLKKTLAVRFGKRFALFQYIFSLILSYFILITFYILTNYSKKYILAPLLSFPLALILIWQILNFAGEKLNKTLALSALLSLLFSLLISGGIVLLK